MTNRNFSDQLITSVHPELAEFFRDPFKFDTNITRLLEPLILNPINNGLGFYPESRRKFITTDVEVHQHVKTLGIDVPSFLGAGGPREKIAFDPRTVNVGVVVAGGTAPGTNAVIHSIVKRHIRDYGLTTGQIYGFIGGFRGLGGNGTNNVCNLNMEIVSDWHVRAGCEIGMSRYREDIGKMVDNLVKHRIDILYMIGGDGTLEAAYRITQEIAKRGLKIVVATVPKTIDNDIFWSWKSFGYDTAIGEATQMINNFHENIRTHGRIGTIIFYGGESGFLAANAAHSSGVADAVLIPEEKVDMDKLLDYAARCAARRHPLMENHALIVAAEGIALKEPFFGMIANEMVRRGSIKNVSEFEIPEAGMTEEIRNAFTYVYYQKFFERFGTSENSPVITEPRSLVNSVRPSHIDIRFCQRLAYNAVDNALAGYTGFMSSYWMTEYVLVPLSLVAGKHKRIPINGWFWKNLKATTGQPQW